MTLTVLNVAYALCAVRSVGGAEQVLSAIDRALVEAGAHSIVVACEGSRVHGTLHPTPLPTGVIDDGVHATARAAHARAIETVLATHDVDVVHFHGVDFHTYLPPEGVPALATLHLPPSWYPRGAVAPTRAQTFVHCVSESQLRACPPSAAMLPPIPNGVVIPPVSPPRGAREGVVALGRICPEKGFHIALAAARRAGAALTLAGRVFPYAAHIDYWEREIVPRLDDRRRFVGVVDPERRTALLSRARCVVIPSLVDETSSLVAMEALAVGTPVVAFGKGALPEIVDHGITGFLVHDEREMSDAIDAASTLDPEACRAAAVERFSVDTMTARYLERYAMLARGARGGAAAVKVERVRSPAIALVTPHAQPNPDFTVSSTEEAMRALVPEWRYLAAAAGATPFQRPEWLLPWWRHFGSGAPAMLEMRLRGELVGLAPLYVRHDANGERVLAMIGTGNTDYVDVIACPSHRRAIVATLVSYIADTRTEWDRCELGPLAAGSPLLGARAPTGCQVEAEVMDVCPVLSLSGATHDVANSIPSRFLAQLRYTARRLKRDHDVRFQAADRASAPALLDALFMLHGARWESRGSDGVLADERTRAFHHDVATAMAEQGLLRLYAMRVDGEIAAAFHGFRDPKRLYYYIGGFDPAFGRHSAGSLVILHAIEAAARDGATEVDFLRGAEPYKYRWGATDRGVSAWRLRAASIESEEAA